MATPHDRHIEGASEGTDRDGLHVYSFQTKEAHWDPPPGAPDGQFHYDS